MIIHGLTIGAKACPNQIREFCYGLDITKDSFIDALKMLIAFFEKLQIVRLWNFQRHDVSKRLVI
jgi:hypothetical protein